MPSLTRLAPALVIATTLLACAAPEPADEEVRSETAAMSGYTGGFPSYTSIDRPAYAPEGFYPERNVGSYYGPCGPLSATWLMTWYVGRGPGGTATNQDAFDKVSAYAQGDRWLPGSSPYGLSFAIDKMLERSIYGGLARYRTGASIEDIRALVASGRPVIVLIQWKEEGARLVTMHYVTVFSYRRVGDSFVYVVHDNGSFEEIGEQALEPARNTQFYARGIVYIDRPVPVDLPPST